MTNNIINFQKYRLKREIIDPRYREINNISTLFKRYNFKEELKLLVEYYDDLNLYVEELEKQDWDIEKIPKKFVEKLEQSFKRLCRTTEIKLMQLGY